VLLAFVSLRDSAAAITAPAGWTLIRSDDVSTLTTTPAVMASFWKAAVSEGASYTFTLGASAQAEGHILAYRGVNTATPIDTHSGAVGAGGQTTLLVPGVITTAANDYLVGVASGKVLPNSLTPPVGMVERTDTTTNRELGTADVLRPVAGATGDQTFTFGAQTGRRIGHLIALRR